MKDTCGSWLKRNDLKEFFAFEASILKYDHDWQGHHHLEYLEFYCEQSGRMVDISFLFPISVTVEHHCSDTFLTLMIRSAVFFEVCQFFQSIVFLEYPKQFCARPKRISYSKGPKNSSFLKKHTKPNIGWNDENQVSSLTRKQLRLCL